MFPAFARTAALLVVISAILSGCASPPGSAFLCGTWSAPSLSRPDQPIVITLDSSGQAFEQIGDYHGRGIWKPEQNSACISWASGWTGLLRPAAAGQWELATWKKGTSLNHRPDDVQPARRLGPAKLRAAE